MTDSITPKSSARWEAFGVDPAGNNAVRILAVDDNEALRYSIVRSLRDAGYQVVEAKTGEEAIAFAAELPDLITLDVNLPDIHGFQVCRLIKENPATTHIPILHLSSTFVDPESRVQGLASGADAYLTEPIDRAELVATIGALLRLKQAETIARQQAGEAERARQELAELNDTLETRVNQRTAELKTANESLRELSGHLLQIQDEERRRLARELHDSAGQLLAAISMNISKVAREKEKLSTGAGRSVEEAADLVQQALVEIRTMSHLLHPPLLEEVGLESALRGFIEGFAQRSKIDVNLVVKPGFERLSPDLEITIFRVIQECLTNVHRHSGSPKAEVRLTRRHGCIHLEVSDEGKGIPLDKLDLNSPATLGVGFRGMRERIRQLGGTLQVHSTGKGTIVEATLPISR